MSLPRNPEEADTLDMSLKHTLRNWVSRSKPPVDGKSRLLQAASGISQQTSENKMSKIAILISMTLNDDFLQLYMESSKTAPYYSLFPGTLSMHHHNGLFAD